MTNLIGPSCQRTWVLPHPKNTAARLLWVFIWTHKVTMVPAGALPSDVGCVYCTKDTSWLYCVQPLPCVCSNLFIIMWSLNLSSNYGKNPSCPWNKAEKCLAAGEGTKSLKAAVLNNNVIKAIFKCGWRCSLLSDAAFCQESFAKVAFAKIVGYMGFCQNFCIGIDYSTVTLTCRSIWGSCI